ncbi:MAG: SUMF1/EgtB/PvdO family nonheme iron enzyme [Pseudomonadota bacterium]|nr:SUMF1/EgtB/PvdO family nonheme iron enzyme [Pseudomonadota bacterium]MDP1906258.1 SUMF1/EgtB/PvdO family nonheme iron enzyme [Pseudomonadota bacterium]MDP2353804.1 SUMF1/EgtB/PvdO family nonheme iron enzyme [Pseudomonadota bacterium]
MNTSRWMVLVMNLAVLLLAAGLGGCGGGGGGGAPAVAVSAPEQVTVDGGRTRITVTWSGVNGASSYNIYYATTTPVNPATAAKVAGVGSPQTIRGLLADTRYYTVVTAVGPSGESVVSKEKTALTVANSATAPPLAPINIHADAGIGQATVSWDTSDGATSYNLYYGTSATVSKATGTKITGVTSPRTQGLSSGTTYYVIVTAVSAAGESADSFYAMTTPSASPPPIAPTNLQAALDPLDPTKVVLTWTASAGATRYNLYYGNAWGVTQASGTAINNVSSPYSANGFPLNKAAFFVVSAANATGESSTSHQAAATPRAAAVIAANARMVSIPAGNFLFGDSSDGLAYALPVKNLAISGFCMDRYETTYDLWKTVHDWAIANGYVFDNTGKLGADGLGTDMPVTTISWYDTVKWLNAISEMGGLTPAYYTDLAQSTVYRTGRVNLTNAMVNWTGNGYRLPTEAEWEKAARGGLAANRWSWGNDPASLGLVDPNIANYNEGRATSVGIYSPNGYGLYDMAGNVWEWVWNWWVDDYNHASVVASDPLGPDAPIAVDKDFRVRRGGGYAYGVRYLRNAERMGRVPTYIATYFGFRSIRSANIPGACP